MKKLICIALILLLIFTGCYSRENVLIENLTDPTIPRETETKREWTNKDKTEHLQKAMSGKVNMRSTGSSINMRAIKHTIKSFCCMDIDHDNENEIIFFNEYGSAMSILDYKDEEAYYEEFYLISGKMILNQKGYLHYFESYDDEIHYARITDAFTKQHELIFDYGSCSYDGEAITRDVCEQLINSFIAEPAVMYEFTEENISLYVDIEVKSSQKNSYKLITDEKVENSFNSLTLMQKVLMEEVQVLDTADGGMKQVSEVPFYRKGGSFYYCDLDGDGVKEVVLNYDECSILREDNGTVYRYAYNSRGMAPLYEDGTMNSSMGADTGCLERIVKFTQNEIITEQIYYYNRGVYYKEYNSEDELLALTEKELAEIKETYKEIPAKNYDFSVSNVINVIK